MERFQRLKRSHSKIETRFVISIIKIGKRTSIFVRSNKEFAKNGAQQTEVLSKSFHSQKWRDCKNYLKKNKKTKNVQKKYAGYIEDPL